MVKAPLQNNKNWASSKCLLRKREKMYLPQILGMRNSKNGTSCTVMYLGFTYMLKVAPATFLLVCFVCLRESTSETRKNASYFTLKAIHVLEIINF